MNGSVTPSVLVEHPRQHGPVRLDVQPFAYDPSNPQCVLVPVCWHSHTFQGSITFWQLLHQGIDAASPLNCEISLTRAALQNAIDQQQRNKEPRPIRDIRRVPLFSRRKLRPNSAKPSDAKRSRSGCRDHAPSLTPGPKGRPCRTQRNPVPVDDPATKASECELVPES